MYRTKKILEIISILDDLQKSGVTLAEAVKSLHRKETIPFDDVWPAVMTIRQTSEKEAMQLTKQWCGYYKNVMD